MTSNPAPQTTGVTLGKVGYILSTCGAAIALVVWAGNGVWHVWSQDAGTAATRATTVRVAAAAAGSGAAMTGPVAGQGTTARWLGDDVPIVELVGSQDQADALQPALIAAETIRLQYALPPLNVEVKVVSPDERIQALLDVAEQNRQRAVMGLPNIVVHDRTGSADVTPYVLNQ
jgi:hypothetical protein